MLKTPPHILITTPESLYLILTSPRGRRYARTVRTVIVDEIHTLCGNKRGAHLALSLERLDHLVAEGIEQGSRDQGPPEEAEEGAEAAGTGPLSYCRSARAGVQRIGLSATQRPAAGSQLRFSGRAMPADEAAPVPSSGEAAPVPRPVTIVDTGYRKPLDLQVVTVVEDFGQLARRHDLARRDRPAAKRDQAPPHYPGLRQQPAAGRAHGRPAERAVGRRRVRGGATGQHRDTGTWWTGA